MRAISGSSWGASKSNLLQVYRATIRSVLDYGSEAIDLGCKEIIDTYDKRQYQALKICCGDMKGTSAVPRLCKWNEVSFLSTYVVRSSWQTTPLSLSPTKLNLLKLNTSFQMAGSPSLKLDSTPKWRNETKPPHTRMSSPSFRQTS